MRTKKAVLNVITNFILQVILITYGFVIPKIIITSFGSNVNGLITSVTQFLGYIVLLESGFGPVLKATLYKPIAEKDKKTIARILQASDSFFKKIAYIFVAYIVVLSLLYPLLVNNDFEYIYSFSLIIIISISIFIEYFFGMTYKLYLQAEQKSYIISIVQIITYIVNIITIIILVRLNFSIHIIKLISGLLFSIRPIVLRLYVRKKCIITFDNNIEKYEIKNKWDGLAQHIASVIHNNTDVVLLTLFCGLIEVSIYSVYYMIISGVKKIITIISNSVESGFGDIIAKDENTLLNKKFGVYEFVNNSLVTIVFSCTLLLISPFVSIYTKNVADANYVKPLFGYLIVISEYLCMLRLPYIDITYAAGHFKETKKGAWVECLTNIIISSLFVFKFGLAGVVVGTIIAMFIRMCEFVYHSNKYILKRNVYVSAKKIIICFIETLIIFGIVNSIHLQIPSNYLDWIINSLIIFIISLVIILPLNIFLFRNDFKELLASFKIPIKKKEKVNNYE